MSAFNAVAEFERELCEYTGAPYAVTMDRCCDAIQAALEYMVTIYGTRTIRIPRYTYQGVPQRILRAGCGVECRHDDSWSGGYYLWPFPVFDYARRFRPGMYRRGGYHCLSFHRSKILGYTKGGAVLCPDQRSYEWLKQWGHDGSERGTRGPGIIGGGSWMLPETAAALLQNLHWLKTYYPEGKSDLPWQTTNSPTTWTNYWDLSTFDWNGEWKKQRKI